MWEEFREQRLSVLRDAIEKNKVDEGIIPLIEKINKNENLVTTSSCFGRIVLLGFDLIKRKQTAEFYRKWHRKVETEEVELAVVSYTGKLPLWFKVEPFILHVSARDFSAAEEFMKKMRSCGVKRGGIQGTSKGRITIEVQGTIGMSLPVDGVEVGWEFLVDVANKLMNINAAQIRKLERIKW
ncbi:MAG: hypothetical protein QXT05_03585 [Candidatus Bilamarchaeaceae archaeon]